jgi:hypothetical protein
MLGDVPLLGQPNTRPYAEATITIERSRLSELASTTRYIQRYLLDVQQAIHVALLAQGFDQLDLQDGVSL